MALPLDAPSPDAPPDGLYGHRPLGTTAGLRHHRRPFRYRNSLSLCRCSDDALRTSERLQAGVGGLS
jgi:hypothetical protein